MVADDNKSIHPKFISSIYFKTNQFFQSSLFWGLIEIKIDFNNIAKLVRYLWYAF